MDVEFLSQELDRLLTHTNELFDLLAREREALTGRDINSLSEIIERKESACRVLATAQSQFESRSISDWLLEIPSDRRSELDGQYEQLLEMAESCKRLNQVNGKITHRSQQSNIALLKVLTGELEPLYEQHGRSQPNRSGTGSSIVKA